MERRVENPVIGDVVTFVKTSEETGGERTLLVDVDGVKQALGEGDEATAPPGSLHCFSNTSGDRAVFQIELRPGHEGFEKSLRVGYALAADGPTNKGDSEEPDAHGGVTRVVRDATPGYLHAALLSA